MAIVWKVSHPERLIIAYGKEGVTATDILYSADMFARTGINTYRKLFDFTRLTGTMSQADLRLVGERMKVRAPGQPFRPTALVLPPDRLAAPPRLSQPAAAPDTTAPLSHDSPFPRVCLHHT